jgi:hypothetical protein
VQEGAELAHDHATLAVGDQRKGVALLADAGRQRGAEQRRVHLDAGVAQRVLDDVQRDGVDRDGGQRREVGFDDGGGHGVRSRLRPG